MWRTKHAQREHRSGQTRYDSTAIEANQLLQTVLGAQPLEAWQANIEKEGAVILDAGGGPARCYWLPDTAWKSWTSTGS
jgi:hypothetical protein